MFMYTAGGSLYDYYTLIDFYVCVRFPHFPIILVVLLYLRKSNVNRNIEHFCFAQNLEKPLSIIVFRSSL